MKTLMCSLAAVMSLALGSGILAAAEETVITGTVEGFDKNGSMYLNIGTRRPKAFMAYKVIATKIEKVGDAEGGSKKR